MRCVLTVLLPVFMSLFTIHSGIHAQTKDPAEPKKDKPKLGIGDAAPAFKITKWVQGEEVKEFNKDHVYVFEFWATWCGPCIQAMPHLVELQDEHKDKGLIVVGVTVKDEGNTEKKVVDFIKKNAKKITYRMAFCEDEATYKNYMTAAGQDGIPCSFVIGKDGKIAYIGHPANLDDVLPKVLAGTWKGKEDADLLDKINDEMYAIFEKGGKDPAAGLKSLEEFVKKHPTKSTNPDLVIQKTVFLSRAGKSDELKSQIEEMIATSDKKKKASPAVYAALILVNDEINPMKKHHDLAVKAIEVALKHETEDSQLYIAAMDVYLAVGKRDDAVKLGDKAIALVEDAKQKEQVSKIVKSKLEAMKK